MSTTETKMLIPVTGMTCSACAARIEKALNRAAGVTGAVVNFATEKAEVSWDPHQLDRERGRVLMRAREEHVDDIAEWPQN